MTPQQEKQLAIAESVNDTANQISKLCSEFHSNSYKGKRLKGNNYRKQRRWIKKKQKLEQAKLAFGASISAGMGAMRIQMIASQPIPKFQKGSS